MRVNINIVKTPTAFLPYAYTAGLSFADSEQRKFNPHVMIRDVCLFGGLDKIGFGDHAIHEKPSRKARDRNPKIRMKKVLHNGLLIIHCIFSILLSVNIFI